MKKLLKQNSLAGMRARRILKVRLFAFAALALIAGMAYATNPKSAAVATIAIVLPFTIEGAVKKEADLTPEEKDALQVIQSQINKGLEEYTKNNITAEALGDIIKKSLDSEIKNPSSDFSNRMKELDKLPEALKKMAEEIQGLKDKGLNMKDNENPIGAAIKKALESDKFKAFAEGNMKRSGTIRFETKDMSLGSNYTGGILISRQTDKVAENPQPRKINMRDVMMVEQGESEYPSVTYSQITDLDRNAAAVSENGVLPESAFNAKEITDQTHRIGTIAFISKRMLKSLKWLQSYLTNRIPSWIKMAEDFQILKGDGQGDNLTGVMKSCPDFKTVINSLVSGTAGSITGVESFNGGTQTKITFKDPQATINNGANITFAAFANAAYNATFVVNKVSDRVIVVDVAYTAQTAEQIAAATFVVGGEFLKTVEDPTIADVLLASQAYLTYAEFSPKTVALNPIDVFRLRVLKDTQTRYLNIIQNVNGVFYIGGLPIVETTAIATGEFFMGDTEMGASITDFSALELEFAEDVDTKRKNQVAVICQEEVIVPLYNPFAFLKGKFSEIVDLIKISA